MKEIVINTGAQRNVLGHVISGAIASAVISGAINYKKVKSNELEKKAAIKDTIKKTSQGAIATGAAIATANYLGEKGGLLKAVTALSVGAMGIYALEVIEEQLDKKYLTNENCLLEEEINE
ncbi:hypothetical protein [Arcobacter sp. F2176]|uniref:hypothetical protein n=1 Tax=unclassified Arcobacter TaxID=2593671 RepID=UPI00100BFD78|nr:hypothetical protein [Arcobacter sp. F2176]RXJ82417.1 hypothetical protein CRU95_02885 [Arcobacter sp. F2176]|eukprot:TRINITY_DN1779_c0_g1_i2.p5 TRINITY_DN1779_c0_g1~~TRINITY_DN1779_c0_g1_i2.p5  ORF type:complete len:121 (+),score=2.14 TRINITY_DN1779_c0_g1_i2:1987-2349(+)